jgi:hypothetical protein
MKLIAQDDTLIIQLEGAERFWALKNNVQVPRFAVLDVDYNPEVPVLQDFSGHLRFPGSNWFWQFMAGTFIRGGVREFWYVRMQTPGVLLIDIKPGMFPYQKIRLSCDPETAQGVADWWHHGKPEQA